MTTPTVTPPAETNDAELTRRAGRGDADSLRTLYERHAGPLIAFLRTGAPGEAGDVHQDVWPRITSALESFDGENFRAWAFRIARDALADRRRRGTIETVSLEANGQGNPIDLTDPHGDDPFAADRKALAGWLGNLTTAEAQVVRARLEGVDSARIAGKAGVAVERVHKLFQQATARFADPSDILEMPAPVVFDVPDAPAELAPWLERQLVGLDLGRVAAELEAVHAGRPGGELTPELEAAISDRLPAVLESGLSALPLPLLRNLFRHSRLLLNLQERVLVDGGAYWARLQANDEELARLVEGGWPGVRSLIPTPPGATPEAEAPAAVRVAPRRPQARPPRIWALRLWARSATVLASASLFLYAVEHLDPPARRPSPLALPSNPFAARVEWGWNRPGVIDVTGPAPAYFTGLANALNEWFNQHGETPDGFALRLGELRTGCMRLIVADHKRLPPDDRSWLIDRCREWAGKLDEAVHALERGEPVGRVRTEVGASVNRLIDALRERGRSA